MNVGETIKALRLDMEMTQKQLAEKAEISQAALSAIERSEKAPTVETLHSIASALGVLVSDLLGEQFCPVCGFEYAYDEGLDSPAHKKEHAKAESIINRFGFYWPYRVRKIEATIATAILSNPNAPPPVRYDAAIRLFKALFSRSAVACPGKHPDFRTYAAMLLSSSDFSQSILPDTREQLEAEFGQVDGIPTGTYYRPSRDEKRIDAICENLRVLPEKYLSIVEAICDLPD